MKNQVLLNKMDIRFGINTYIEWRIFMDSNLIPKIVHYCWFGGNEKPEYIKKYIRSWKENLHDYEIVEWNEENFNVNYCNYVKDAYALKKYAFVSDVARLYALYNFGGIYLDTDVEVLKSFDDLIKEKKAIFGFEVENRIATSFMATTKHNEIIYMFLKKYESIDFILSNNKLNLTPNVEYLTDLLKEEGLVENGSYQELNNGIFVYPSKYFSPYDYINCINDADDESYCIHYFVVSWLNKSVKLKRSIKTFLVKIIGKKGLIYFRKKKNSFLKFTKLKLF